METTGNTMRITIDTSTVLGSVKPVNGVGQPPITNLRDYPLFHYLAEAGIPFSRLHDVGGMFGRNVFVDIPNLFRDFDADENDPANYDFAFTDRLLAKLVENGVEPFYRLGVTIENYVDIRRYRTEPPKDFEKWARICEHVIRHYTEGWADGYRYKITHWEIWNEPEDLGIETNPMWHGTFDEFCRFYEVASRHIKTAFPHLKIGGYASCGIDYPGDAARGRHWRECFHAFIKFVRERGCPLDFFSWHSYYDVAAVVEQARYIRAALDEAGFAGVPTCLDEWLPTPNHDKLGSAQQAAEIAAALIAFQNGPVDSAAIYDARCGIGNYSPLFNPLTYKPHKAYYAFMAFNELRKRGTAVEVLRNEPRPVALYSAAARGEDGSIAVMLANPSEEEVPIELEIVDGLSRKATLKPRGGDLSGEAALNGVEAATAASTPRCRITDETRTWEEAPLPVALPPHGIVLVECALPPATAIPTAIPSSEQSPYWAAPGYWDRHHAAKLAEIAVGPKDYDCVFLGDSITHNWEGWSDPADNAVATAAYASGQLKTPDGPGRAVWEELKAQGLRLLNLGLGGDKTQNVLWRLDHGEMDGYRTRFVALMIGVNNEIDSREDRAEGIRAILEKIHERQPDATILLHPIFPCGATPNDPRRISCEKTNSIIRCFADGGRIVWLDFNDKFLDADGNLSEAMMPDFLHPLEAGYRIWAAALRPFLCGQDIFGDI